MRHRFCSSAHKVRFCFQDAKFETPATQSVEESIQYESRAHGKCQTRDTNFGVISVYLRSKDEFSHKIIIGEEEKKANICSWPLCFI